MVGQLRPRRFRLGLVGALVVAAGIGIAVLAPEPPATAQICSRVAAENTTLDKLRQVSQASIVENKHLGAVLSQIRERQIERAEARSQSAPRRQGQVGHMFRVG